MNHAAAFALRAARLPQDALHRGRMRRALWPDEAGVDGIDELRAAMQPAADACLWPAIAATGETVGFAGARRRVDHVDGTSSSPVGFLEAWYVEPAWRGRGVGRALVEAVADWSRASGCGELASDALLENRLSHAAHLGCGFEETGRVVFFRRALAP